MFAALALRSVLAAVLVAQPAAVAAPAPAAAPASEAVPVQSPTSSVPVQKPSTPTPVQPAPAPAPTRVYDGVDVLSPPTVESSPPAQTVPAPGVTPIAPPTEPEEIEGPIDEPEPAYDPLVDSPEAIRAKHVVSGGIVFTVVGGVLTIGGIAMSTAKVNVPGSPDQPCNVAGDRAGNGCTPGGRDRAVAALVIPGALLLAGGVAMLVVGKLQQRRLRTTLQADKRGFMIGAAFRF